MDDEMEQYDVPES